MITIATKPFGDLEIDERQVLDFPLGLMGFEMYKRFALLNHDSTPFFILQSLDEVDLAFILIDPAVVDPDYNPAFREEDLAEVGFGELVKDNILVFTLVTIPSDDFNDMTANFLGPLVIDRHKRIGRQVISQNASYQVKHSLAGGLG